MIGLLRGNKSWWRRLVNGTLALTAASGALFAAVPVAMAAPPAQDDVPTDEGPFATWLEHLFAREVHALEGQAMSLDFANEVVGNAQTWIDELAAQGVDVSELERALAAFETGIADAQTSHDAAAEILRVHDGFDDDGNLLDRQAAAETVRSAGRALRDAHRKLADATTQFRRAVGDWRREHRDAGS